MHKEADLLVIAGREFRSRLFLGTAGYPNRKCMLDAVAASGTEMTTASIRRISLAGDDESLVELLGGKVHFLPNTAGCQTARDAVLTLLESAWRVIPSIEELPIHEMWVGHRPGSRDDAPILGGGSIPGLIYATGHHRNGILLTPITADLIAELILDGVADPALAPFGIERFALARAAE